MDRLTDEERRVAELNLHRVGRFLRIHRLDPDEWYDVAIFGYLSGIQLACRENSEIPAEERRIWNLLDSCMYHAVGTELHRRHMRKRGENRAPLSLDSTAANNDEGEMSLYELVPGPEDTEAAVLDRDLIDRCLAAATPRQAECIKLSAAGYDNTAIGTMLGLSTQTVSKHLTYFYERTRAVREDRPVNKVPASKVRYEQAHRETRREQVKEYQAAYREANKERIRSYARAYREANREAIREQNRRYRDAHPEKIRAIKKKYRDAHREQINAYARACRQAKKNAAADAATPTTAEN